MWSLLVLSLVASPADAIPPPFSAQVSDPMLAPMPAAARVVGSWSEAMALLREHSIDDRSAVVELERANARSRQALGTLLPNLRFSSSLAIDALNPDRPAFQSAATGASTGGGSGGVSPSVPLGTATLILNQSLVDLGAWRALEASEAFVKSAEASLDEQRRRLVRGLALSIVAVAAAERVAELNREGLRLALEREALTRRSVELGSATELDLVRVRQDVATARGLVVSGDEQLRRTRDAFGAALGLEHDLGISRSFDIGALVDDSSTQCRKLEHFTDRSDLVALRAQEDAARASRLQALAGYYPSLGLQSTLFGFTTSPGFGQLATWNVSAVLNVPIWEGGSRGALVAERRAGEESAALALERARRQLTIEVDRSRRGVEVARQLLESSSEARALAARNDEMTRRSFEVGRSGSLELVQSAQQLRQSDLTLAAREFEWVQARLEAFLTEARCDW